jgi:hypothetical protein
VAYFGLAESRTYSTARETLALFLGAATHFAALPPPGSAATNAPKSFMTISRYANYSLADEAVKDRRRKSAPVRWTSVESPSAGVA